MTVSIDDVLVGVVVARDCGAGSPEGLDGEIAAALAEARAGADGAVAGEVRTLLRYGKYKPTGRGKPASEYLLNAAREHRFPRVGTLVDINNLISLRSRLPISLIDLDRAGTSAFAVRRGRAGESYVFNAAGQSIDLEDLLLLARLPGDRPCANPVKDALDTKLVETSQSVMAVLYAPASLRVRLAEATAEFGRALERWAGAPAAATAVLARQR